MALANFFCSSSTRNMFVRIIYPGGQVELHDRPILAAEIMQRNPKCCVTRPDVFREPSAVVSPDTVLMLGQKFYVVPMSTLRKLQRHSARSLKTLHIQHHSPRLPPRHQHHSNNYGRNKSTPKRSFSCLTQSQVELDDSSFDGSRKSSANETAKAAHKLDDKCFKLLPAISKTKPAKQEMDGMRTRENSKETEGPPNRLTKNMTPTTPTYHWQPSLDSISEE